MSDAVQETVETEPQRWVQFEGLDNVRDIGGLPLRDGGATRFGQLLRSANLRYAVSVVPNVSLFEYEVEFHLKAAHDVS